MDRRSFLGLIPTAAVASRVMDAEIMRSEGPIYKGYRIWEWTGWKGTQSNVSQVGQWLAAPLDIYGKPIPYRVLKEYRHNLEDIPKPYLYVSVPGGEGPYAPGWIFDISVHPGQELIDKRTSEKVKERERRRGLRRMFRLIDRTVNS